LCDLSELAESYKNNLFLNDNKFFEMFETIKKNLFEFNNNKNIALFWATVGNCFLKHIYRDLNFKIPISFICGEAGSGKSATADNFFNKILLTNEIIEDINTTTIFSIINKLSSSNFSTVIINEFKGGEGKAEKLEEVIKAIYDGTTFTRGQQNLLLKHYNFTNNIILIGEEEAKDKATAERFLFINLTKKESQKHKKEFKEIARQANQKKLSFVGFKLLIEATNTTSKEITEIYEGLSDVDNIEAIDNERQKHNLKISLTSLNWICEKLRIEEAEKKLLFFEVVQFFKQNKTTDHKIKFDNTIEAVNILFCQDYIKEEAQQNYFIIKDNFINIQTNELIAVLNNNKNQFETNTIILNNTVLNNNFKNNFNIIKDREYIGGKQKRIIKINIFDFLEYCNNKNIDFYSIIPASTEAEAKKKKLQANNFYFN